MTETLGAFADGIASIRRTLADTDDALRVVGFMNACDEVAGYVSHGLDRATADDELDDMAIANGLDDGDAVQFIIGKAFGKIDPPDLVPDPDFREVDERPQTNGHDHDPPKLLPLIDLRLWQGVTPRARQWIVRERIPNLNVTLLTGQGGVGKTLLVQQLSVATVLGRDWIGELPEPGPVLLLTAEDDEDELHFRYDRIAAHYDASFDQLAAAGLHLMSLAGKDAALAVADNRGIVKPTELFHTLVRTAEVLRPRWIGLDTAADCFIINERDRSQVRQCLSLLRGLALRIMGAVILLAHPSLTGISSGTGLSGSTAWNNSVRSRLYLKSDKPKKDDQAEGDDEVDTSSPRILEFMKSNYSALARPVRLTWRDGLLVPDTVPSLPPIERAAADERAKTAFLTILRRFNKQDRPVSDKLRANNFACNEFADEPEALKLNDKLPARKRMLQQAMAALFTEDRIHCGLGPRSLASRPSKQRECLYATGILL
jgi:RecA-family ATPase